MDNTFTVRRTQLWIMATAQGDDRERLASTPRWAGTLALQFFANLLVLGVFCTAAAFIAYLSVSAIYPAAVPFLWLAVLGIVISFTNAELTDTEAKILADELEQLKDRSWSELWVYGLTYVMMFIGLVSFEVGVLGIAAAYLASTTSLGVVAVLLAVWYPMVDVWAGRNIGMNVASIGALIALVVMIPIALAHHVSPSIARKAAMDFRTSLR